MQQRFVGSGDFVDLDVDGQTDLDHVAISGVSTFSNTINANGDLDVDGTTDLDVLNVAETATFSATLMLISLLMLREISMLLHLEQVFQHILDLFMMN